MNLIRNKYLEKIENYIGTPLIKVITGQRRVGKTVLMKQILQKFPTHEVSFCSKEDEHFSFIQTKDDLTLFLESEKKAGKKYFFIDEVQMIEEWEKSILSLFSQNPNFEIFLSGSNAHLLSSELSTLLSGRYIEFHIHPFSFHEFSEYFSLPLSSETFLKYIQEGGFPTIYALQKTPQLQKEWIQTLINTIFLKDITARYRIQNVHLLEEIFMFLVSNVGNITSLSKIVKTLKSKNITTNLNTLHQYIGYLKNTFLVYEAPLYDLEGKKVFDRERKFYISDHSIRNALFSSYDHGVGKHLENIIYLEGIRRGYRVFVGRIKKKEVDFIFEKNGEKIYVQVAYMLTDEKAIEREFSSLEEISDNWKKYVVTLDPISIGNRNGIQHIQIWELERIFH